MKKVCLLFLLAILPFVVYADAEEIDGIYYILDLEAKTAEVTMPYAGYYSGDVVIPPNVTFKDNVCEVTSIGHVAFFFCSGLTSVTIPNSVTSIKTLAFSGCTGLTALTIPSSVTSIEYAAFSGCTGLTSITFPNSVTFIAPEAFDKTPWYNNQPDGIVYAGKMLYKYKGTMPDGTTIKIEDGTLGIVNRAFGDCRGLTSLTIPNSVNSIGNDAFVGCAGLTSIIVEEGNAVYDSRENCNAIIETASNTLIAGCQKTIIPNSVTSIGRSAFWECSSLASITIPNSVTSIGEYAFHGCSGLTSITIPNSVTSIGGCAFDGCSGLTSVTIPNSVTSIANGAFSYCSKLTSIIVEAGNSVYDSRENCNAIIETASNTLIAGCQSTIIPNSATSIGDHAFQGCGLTSIPIPNSVTSIGDYAFSACGLTSVTIPNSVTSIGDYAFSFCGLTSITIPSCVTSIGCQVFNSCDRLTGVYCYAENVPTTNIDAFGGLIIDNVIFYVPAGSVDAYKAAEPWNGCKEILPIAEAASITIGGKGLTTYTSKYNLDFSGFGDEVKAYVATGYDYDTKTIWLTRVKDVPAGTALMVKGAAGKTYEVPVKEISGSYYKNMFVGNTTGSDMVLNETSDGMTNYYLKDGQFLSVKGSAKINDGKSYLQIPTAAPTAKAGSSQTMTMNAYGFASYCGSQDLDFTDVEGLKAYAATGYDDATGIIWLTRVMRVSAGTPLLLKGAPSTEDKVSSYTVPSLAVSSYYANMLKGNTSSEQLVINPTDGEMTNYYLKGNQLLKVSGTANIHPGKAYMQIPTRHVTRAEEDVVSGAPYYNIGEEPEVISMQIGTRGIDGDDADTTGISEVKSDDADRGEWYNLQGQRVGNPGKGLYIKNGKKVIVR